MNIGGGDESGRRRGVARAGVRAAAALAFCALGALVAATAVADPPAAPAYEAIEVPNGGSIAGVATLQGAIPKPAEIPVVRDQEVCGHGPVISEALVVDPASKGIRFVIVHLEIQKGRKLELPATNPELDQKGCKYAPHVVLVPAGGALDVLNPDGILHNVHTYSSKNPGYNKAQTRRLKKITLPFAAPEIITILCDTHMWMGGVIVVHEHPYYAITDAKGAYRLEGIPPGEYKLHWWQETLGKGVQTVTVSAGAESRADLSLGPAK
ncbi:MAG: hypothetical protein HYZ53_12620 [Planctomycetes bacterium]|nr:hypothetical protein [Planctomycetota bacterium]